jgi:hypothetical protein
MGPPVSLGDPGGAHRIICVYAMSTNCTKQPQSGNETGAAVWWPELSQCLHSPQKDVGKGLETKPPSLQPGNTTNDEISAYATVQRAPSFSSV